jgi:hypothetical protein
MTRPLHYTDSHKTRLIVVARASLASIRRSQRSQGVAGLAAPQSELCLCLVQAAQVCIHPPALRELRHLHLTMYSSVTAALRAIIRRMYVQVALNAHLTKPSASKVERRTSASFSGARAQGRYSMPDSRQRGGAAGAHAGCAGEQTPLKRRPDMQPRSAGRTRLQRRTSRMALHVDPLCPMASTEHNAWTLCRLKIAGASCPYRASRKINPTQSMPCKAQYWPDPTAQWQRCRDYTT